MSGEHGKNKRGSIFSQRHCLVVRERLIFDRLPVVIDAMDMKYGMGGETFGMTRSRIQMTQHFKAHTRITNTFRPT